MTGDEKRVRLTPDRMSERTAPGCIRWADWERLPAAVQWFHATMDAQEDKAFGRPCPIENMEDRPL